VAGIIPQIVVQKESEMAQRTILQGFQCLRIIEVNSEIVGFMENPAKRRLDDLKGIRRDWLLRPLGEHREMIDQEVMKGIWTQALLLEPRPDPENKILRQA
jgi:hypothetical protein